MMFQRDRERAPESVTTGLPPAQSGEDVPRWLVLLGLAAGLTLLVALLRYAIDLLGVVFVIILVGFAIRAVSDWLTEGESVSGWAMSALSLGLTGTVLVGLWLLNSGSLTGDDFHKRLPGPVQRTVGWLEQRGWGQRVLLPGGAGPGGLADGRAPSPGPPLAGNGTSAGRSAPAARMPPRLPLPGPGAGRGRPSTVRRPAAGEAEAATRPQAVAPPPPAPAPMSSTVSLSVSPVPAVVGRSVRLTARVTGEAGRSAPTGTVVFLVGDTVLGRVPLRDGTAVLVTLGLHLGEHRLTASYGGDGTYRPSQSSAVTQSITRR